MAVTVGNVYDFLQEKAPFALQMDFDNAGFLWDGRARAFTRCWWPWTSLRA